MTPIAHIETPFRSKFGVPRQAGLVDYEARVVFEPDYRIPEAVRGLEEFDYIWLLWQFHLAQRETWSPTVRPPRLGGNKRVGVFATRSPFRPNNIGLSSVRLLRVAVEPALGPVLYVSGLTSSTVPPSLTSSPTSPMLTAIPVSAAVLHPILRCRGSRSLTQNNSFPNSIQINGKPSSTPLPSTRVPTIRTTHRAAM